MAHERDAELLEHVGADAVGAEHDRVLARRRAGVSHTVVHVGSRVVRDGSGKVAIEVHAMRKQPIVLGERR
jgi:hypothetical protein